jgi:hypothetical protein
LIEDASCKAVAKNEGRMGAKCGLNEKIDMGKEALYENLLVALVLFFCALYFLFNLYAWLAGPSAQPLPPGTP